VIFISAPSFWVPLSVQTGKETEKSHYDPYNFTPMSEAVISGLMLHQVYMTQI